MPRAALILALLAVAVGFGLRAAQAANPTIGYQSADERSYGRLAIDLAERGTYGSRASRLREPLHWPPGAPALFAVAHLIAADEDSIETSDIPAAYYAQAVVGTVTVAAVFGIALLLAGPWAGVVAAWLLALYPPAILQSGEQLSELLGGCLLALAVLALAFGHARSRATRPAAAWPWFALAGVLLGATVLTRTDLLFVPFLLAVATVPFVRPWPRGGLAAGAVVLAGTVLTMAPWTILASKREGSFVPVTTGSGPALFVGTYLPGGGTTVGTKRALADEVKAARPSLAGVPPFELQSRFVMDYVASLRPELEREEAIRAAARANLREYALGQPLDFGLLMLDKVQRMWSRYARGGSRPTSPVYRALHIALVLGSAAGLALGIVRRRDPVLVAVAVAVLASTALHTITVSQARYNLPLMGILVAAGVAGWAWWLADRRAARAA